MEKTTTNEVLVERIEGVKTHFDTGLQGLGQDIRSLTTQVEKTNGRVKRLEKFQAFIQGAVAVIVLILVPILISLLKEYINQ